MGLDEESATYQTLLEKRINTVHETRTVQSRGNHKLFCLAMEGP